MIIESKDNKLIKYAKKLQDKKFAIKEGKTLVESPKIIKELIDLGYFIEEIIISQDCDISFNNYLGRVTKIANNIVKYLSQTETSTGIFAIVAIPKNKHSFGNKILILDNIQDPTNYGAICRSAVAFGYTTIIDIECCFAYSSKVTRCSMGNNFKLNILKCSYEEVEKIVQTNEIHLIECDMNGKDVKNTRPPVGKFAIIIGNEGNGVNKRLSNISNTRVAIPMLNDVESLNASVSASIVMYTYM